MNMKRPCADVEQNCNDLRGSRRALYSFAEHPVGGKLDGRPADRLDIGHGNIIGSVEDKDFHALRFGLKSCPKLLQQN
jgi:hypothetical protein